MTTYTRIGGYAVEDIGEGPKEKDYYVTDGAGLRHFRHKDYAYARIDFDKKKMNQRKYLLSNELKQQWPEGETRREDEFRISTGKGLWDLTEYAYPINFSSVEKMAKESLNIYQTSGQSQKDWIENGMLPGIGSQSRLYYTAGFLSGHVAAKSLEFAQWCSENNWYYVQSFMQWNNVLWPHWKTSEELYTLFLNQQKQKE